MVTYFNYFPKVKYGNKTAIDISRKSQFVDAALKNTTLLLPYTVNEGERPEDIAFAYYGTIDYYWIILMANNIQNYYTDWVMDDQTLHKYISNKYSEVSGERDAAVLSWTQNQKILENILYYLDADGNETSVDTLIIDRVPTEFHNLRNTREGQRFLIENFMENIEGYTPLRIYDYEVINNENKRKISLINRIYVEDTIADFKRTMR